ncbi:unnamed protein product [Withania somnifera]
MSFSLFLSYIVVMPLMLRFEKDFSYHSHLGPIRIPPLFPFPSAPFPQNEKEDGTLELYYLSAYFLPKILLLQLVGHCAIQISHVFLGFPMLQLPYQFDRSGMDCGWNSSQNPTTSPTSLPPTLSHTSIKIEWFHILSSISYSYSFVSLFQISILISSQD